MDSFHYKLHLFHSIQPDIIPLITFIDFYVSNYNKILQTLSPPSQKTTYFFQRQNLHYLGSPVRLLRQCLLDSQKNDLELFLSKQKCLEIRKQIFVRFNKALIFDLKFTLRSGFITNGLDLTFTLRHFPTLFPLCLLEKLRIRQFYF